MQWYNKPPAKVEQAAQQKRAAEIQENRIRNALRDRDNRSYKDRVDAAYERSRFRNPPEVERPARPITVYSEKYVPKLRPMKASDYDGRPIIDNKTGKPVNAPKGFGAAAKAYGGPKFPAAFGRALRWNPWLNAADLMAMILDYLSRRPRNIPNPQAPPILPSNYEWSYRPVPLSRPKNDWIGPWKFSSSGAPYTGVYWNQYGWFEPPAPLGLHYAQYYQRDYQPGFEWRVVNGAAHRLYEMNPQKQPTPAFTPTGYAQNANSTRRSPGIPNRGIDPTISGVDERARQKEKARIAEQRIEVMARGLARRQMPHARIPPDRGVRERKGLTKLAKFGIALAGALDTMSEAAELVDAIYEALPEDVKKRWEAGVKKDYSIYTTVRQGDNYGQYGMDGADWKIRAIYHNWDKIDIEQAGRNILKNHISDKIIGKYQSGMPVNVGNAVGDGEMYVAKKIDQALDYVIDSAVGVFRR